MNDTQLTIEVSLVYRLVASQFPHWKNLLIQPVAIGGWDNYTFHLGKHMLVRMPSAQEYAGKVEKEQKWLPRLALLLPLPIPVPLAMGEPGEGYPWQWSVYRWIDGETAAFSNNVDMDSVAIRLAQFLHALQQIDTTDAPLPSLGNFSYIGGLIAYHDQTLEGISILKDRIDARAAVEIWNKGVETIWQHAPVWVHGDVSAGNLLVKDGKLSAVIDFGGLAIGDPACDLGIAWKFFQGKSRETFRKMFDIDENTWSRGRAWALWKAIIVTAGLNKTNVVEAAHSWRTIEEILVDYRCN